MDLPRNRLEEEDAAEKGETGYFLDPKESAQRSIDSRSPSPSPGPSSPDEPTAYDRQARHQKLARSERLLPFVSFVAGAVTVLFLNNLLHALFRPANGTFETGWSEEATVLPPNTVEIEPIKFKSAVDFEMDGTEFLVAQPGDKKYVGDDFAEIDKNWEELLWGRYFSLSEDEARVLFGEDEYVDYVDHLRSGWTGGFDMFHQLHCLNQIRQAFHRDVYPEIPIHGKVHLGMYPLYISLSCMLTDWNGLLRTLHRPSSPGCNVLGKCSYHSRQVLLRLWRWLRQE